MGKNIKNILNSFLLVTCCFLFISFVKAAPAQWGIAINQNTEECAGYWAGDEFTKYTLPSGWKAYYPDYDPDNWATSIETPFGTCSFENYSEQLCCQELELEYVSDQIGESTTNILNNNNIYSSQYFILFLLCSIACCFIVIAAVVIFYLLLKKKH